MTKDKPRPEWLRRQMAEARYSELPIPCLHCNHPISVGGQFEPEGWTCAAFPDQILYSILTLREPHAKPVSIQKGSEAYDPKIYTEEVTGRRWHYTADGRWRYVGGDA